MLLVLILIAVVAVTWTSGTVLALRARRGQRFGGRGSHLPMCTRLLWCSGPVVLALTANVVYGQPRDPARLAGTAVVVLALVLATMLVPILVHNARLGQAR
ncbi:MAG: hypothetical protein ABI181_09670 [Mycobacteriaceae bacterium]